MRLSKNRPSSSLVFNMTPMIDIVFLLIIFFMTVSQITRTVDHPVELPKVAEGDTNAQTATVTINLSDEGAIIVAGKKLTLEDTAKALQGQLKKMDDDPNRIKIQIRCDRRCESGHVNKLINRLSAMGFEKVRCAVADE